MKDLTKIKTPFGLLGKKTRKALRASTDQIQVYRDNGWHDIDRPAFLPSCTYRAKPADPIAVLSELQTEVFKKVLTCDALIKRAMQSETAATVPAIFAAVKEWQEAREEALKDWHCSPNSNSKQSCDIRLRLSTADKALLAIKVPS